MSKMAGLSKRMLILFSPEQHALLRQTAKKSGKSIGMLVREAVEQVYFGKIKLEKRKAAQDLIKMRLPVADWGEMEKEIEEAYGKEFE